MTDERRTMIDGVLVTDPDTCYHCGAPWEILTVLHKLDGTTIAMPAGVELRGCPSCARLNRVERPVEREVVQLRLF